MRHRQGRIKVGLKYCGGCRAQYDRVAVVKRMKEALQAQVEFVSPGSREAECILVVTGCKTACADIAMFSDCRVRFITSEEDAAIWIEEQKHSKKNV